MPTNDHPNRRFMRRRRDRDEPYDTVYEPGPFRRAFMWLVDTALEVLYWVRLFR